MPFDPNAFAFPIFPACNNCKHFHINDEDRATCDAFPAGIPDEILDGDDDHTQPVRGDNGIQFEAK